MIAFWVQLLFLIRSLPGRVWPVATSGWYDANGIHVDWWPWPIIYYKATGFWACYLFSYFVSVRACLVAQDIPAIGGQVRVLTQEGF